MNNQDGAIDFDAYIRDTDFNKTINDMKLRMQGFSSSATKDFDKVDNTAKRVSMAIGGYFSIAALSGFGQQLIKVRGEFQKYDAILTNSMGSSAKAADALKMLTNVAATTPFQLDQITAAYVKLVNQGFTPTRAEIIKLGDLSSSVGKDFGQLAEAILDAQTGEFERLKEFGIKAAKSGDLVTFSFKGQKTVVDNTSAAIRNYMLSLGDMQGVKGSMEAISKTLVGQVSNLQDAITSMFNDMGKDSEGVLSGAIASTKYLVDNYAKIGKILETLVITFGAYKAATIAASIAQTIAAGSTAGYTLAQQLQYRALLFTEGAQKLLNKTMLANPYVAAAVAVTALVASIVIFTQKTDGLSDAQRKFKETAKDAAAEATTLFDQLKKTIAGTDERKKIIEQLNEKYPEFLKNMNLEKGTLQDIEAAERKVNNAMLERIASEGKLTDLKNVTSGKLTLLKELQESGLSKEDIATIKKYAEGGTESLRMALNKKTGILEPVQQFQSWGTDIDQIVSKYGNLLIYETQVKKQWDDLISSVQDGTASTVTATPKETKSTPKSKKAKEDFTILKELDDKYQKDSEDWWDAYTEKELNGIAEVAQAEAERFQKRQDYIAETLNSTESFAKKAFDINKEYADKEAALREVLPESELAAPLKKAATERDKSLKDLTQSVLKELGLLNLYMGDGSDFIKEKIKEALPLFEDISKLTTGELAKVKDVIQGIELSPEVIAALKEAGIDTAKFAAELERVKAASANAVDLEQWNKILTAVNKLAGSLGNLGAALQQTGGALGEIGGVMSGLSQSIGDISTSLDKSATKSDKMSAGINGISDLYSMVANQIKANEEAQDRWSAAIMESGHQAALARIEMDAYKESNVFGVDNPYAQAIAGANQYADAMKELNANSAALEAGSVQTGTRKVVSGENIAVGVGAGAAIGSVAGPVGAAIGAVVGGVIGLFSKKTIPVFENLKKQYGEIYNKDTFELNPKILADYDKLDDATKKLVDNWENIKAQAKDAQEAMSATFERLAGDIGTQLSDSLVAAFRNDDIYSAVDDFKSKVSSVIEQIIAQLIFSTYFKKMFDDLTANMEASFADGGDQNIVDDIIKFTDSYASAIPAYADAMKAMQEAMKNQGFDLFNATGAANQLTGSIKNITEETADVLAGQMNAMRINQGMGMGIMRDQLFALNRISVNTDRLEAVENSLKSIDAKMSSGTINDLSGAGLKI